MNWCQKIGHTIPLRKKVSIFGVFLVHIRDECVKIQTRKTLNTDTFHVVFIKKRFLKKRWQLYYFRCESKQTELEKQWKSSEFIINYHYHYFYIWVKYEQRFNSTYHPLQAFGGHYLHYQGTSRLILNCLQELVNNLLNLQITYPGRKYYY